MDSLHPEVFCSQTDIVDTEMDGSIDFNGILNLETNKEFTTNVSLSVIPHVSNKIEVSVLGCNVTNYIYSRTVLMWMQILLNKKKTWTLQLYVLLMRMSVTFPVISEMVVKKAE